VQFHPKSIFAPQTINSIKYTKTQIAANQKVTDFHVKPGKIVPKTLKIVPLNA